jgi:hypothetical protein
MNHFTSQLLVWPDVVGIETVTKLQQIAGVVVLF